MPITQKSTSSDEKLAEIRRLLAERERIDIAIKAILADNTGQRKKTALPRDAFRTLCGV